MAHRVDLNSLSPADRTALVNLILSYLTDAIVATHRTITHQDIHIFTGHRTYIEGLEAYLSANGGGHFVPLPAWNPVNEVPVEFRVMKAKQDGSPWIPANPNMPAVQNPNANAGRAMPAALAFPAVCSFANGDDLGNATNGWHGSVHGNVGGMFTEFNFASAVPLFWCWHAFVDEIYFDWQRCSLPLQRFILQTGTALHVTDDTFDFAMADWDRDALQDLIAIKKSNTGTGSTEIHILSGASDFKQFILQTGTALHETDSTFAFAIADWDGDGKPDLIAIKKSNTGSNSTEVHVLSGASNFQQFLLHTGTGLHETDNTWAFAAADRSGDKRPDLIAIKKSSTGTNSTEVHILA